ncbi:MAG: metallophosphoesterase [Alphaproteobacteria bacterium]|nr:metallophosphoesterase [Alphaproteobacteria bacterium]
MPRILHTADWQLGLKLRRLQGDRGQHARTVRFATLGRIAALAHAEAVDVVVVAGDVFDDNQVSAWEVQRARDALARFAPIPVLLTAGNHDAAEPGGVLARLAEGAPDHVHVALDATPRSLGGVELHPCPLTRRHTVEDPTLDLPPRRAGDVAVRVCVAHGAAHGFGSDDTANRIDVDAVVAKGFDYVALGDWHAPKQLGPRAWYAGTPEPTRFKDAPGRCVLIVDLPEAGAVPTVTPHEVAGLRWEEPEPVTLHGPDDVARLDRWLGELPDRADTLVRLHLRGALPLEERARLDTLLATHAGTLLSLQIRSDTVATVIDPDAVDAPGFLGAALRDLLDRDDPVANEAARLLVRLVAQAEGA